MKCKSHWDKQLGCISLAGGLFWCSYCNEYITAEELINKTKEKRN